MGPTKRGKGTKLMAVADRFGLPLADCAASASPHESRLVAPTLDSRFLNALPQRLIGDRAYDADPLDAELAQLCVELIAPHRRNQTKPCRMIDRCVATNVDGRSSASSFGWAPSAVSSCATSVLPSTIWVLSNSVVSSFCCGRVYEMTAHSVYWTSSAPLSVRSP